MDLPREVYRKCCSCGTVHVAITRASAEELIRDFNRMYATLSSEDRICLYDNTPASLNDYLFCTHCKESAHKFELLSSEDFRRIKGKKLPTILYV